RDGGGDAAPRSLQRSKALEGVRAVGADDIDVAGVVPRELAQSVLVLQALRVRDRRHALESRQCLGAPWLDGIELVVAEVGVPRVQDPALLRPHGDAAVAA